MMAQPGQADLRLHIYPVEKIELVAAIQLQSMILTVIFTLFQRVNS
ncbi:MAG: hypothetical protein Q4F07_05500 [Bacteroidales bacterium]|nr:hypothetical protein [Bacteroidales bacterium]